MTQHIGTQSHFTNECIEVISAVFFERVYITKMLTKGVALVVEFYVFLAFDN